MSNTTNKPSSTAANDGVMRTYNRLVNTLRGTWIHYVFKKLRSVFRKLRSLKDHVMRRSDGLKILLQRYFDVHGKQLNLTDPQTFTEKLFCRMIVLNRRHNPLFTHLSDKYMARAYVSNKVGEQYLVKLLWHGEDPRAIPFDTLPAEYVIKSNHACDHTIVVKGKADRADIIGKVSAWLKDNYYWSAREAQYFHIKPRLMIEEYLSNHDGSGPLNYKFWCFGGTPEVLHISDYTHSINSFFDAKWNLLDLHYREGMSRLAIPKPANFEQMVLIASQLSAGFDFVRVDLYNIGGKIYFGELTFTPNAGWLKFRPERWDVVLGQKWKMLEN